MHKLIFNPLVPSENCWMELKPHILESGCFVERAAKSSCKSFVFSAVIDKVNSGFNKIIVRLLQSSFTDLRPHRYRVVSVDFLLCPKCSLKVGVICFPCNCLSICTAEVD